MPLAFAFPFRPTARALLRTILPLPLPPPPSLSLSLFLSVKLRAADEGALTNERAV